MSEAADPLAGLVDIVTPPEPSLWPQTPAALILIAGLTVAIAGAALWVVRHRRRNRYRQMALAELAATDLQRPNAAAALADLVRRTALAAFPREIVVPLQGAAWLAFLDRSYGGTAFSAGTGRVLAEAPYRPDTEAGDAAALGALVGRWIRTHHV
jgi:Ca-activated chloride channel family protein